MASANRTVCVKRGNMKNRMNAQLKEKRQTASNMAKAFNHLERADELRHKLGGTPLGICRRMSFVEKTTSSPTLNSASRLPKSPNRFDADWQQQVLVECVHDFQPCDHANCVQLAAVTHQQQFASISSSPELRLPQFACQYTWLVCICLWLVRLEKQRQFAHSIIVLIKMA